MRYAKLLLVSATLCFVASCASSRVLAPADGCSVLAEPILGRPTPHAQIANSGDPVLDAQNYGLAETGQLNAANRDKADGLAIIQRCEARDQRAFRRINAPWYAFWER